MVNEADDIRYMQEALKQARLARDKNEVPIGAVIVHNGRIIAKAHNMCETLRDPTAHAEMLAITQAAAAIESQRLLDTTLYVTAEPCSMCAGAIVLARIARVVYGADDEKWGCAGSVYNLFSDNRFNHKPQVTCGCLKAECVEILQQFFRSLREIRK